MSKRTPEDRASSCAFHFADGRQCRMLRSSHSIYCYHHTGKLHPAGEIRQVLLDLVEPVSCGSAPAAALAHMLARVCTGIAEGRVPLKQANAIARVSGVLLKSISKSIKQPLADDSPHAN